MTIADFDHLDKEHKKELLQKCCGSSAWINKMLAEPAFEDLVDMLEVAEEKWYECTREEWKDAFLHHPRIGDLDGARNKFAEAAGEQAGVDENDTSMLLKLSEANREYEKKFGFIFIVFASGKTAAEMYGLLQERINNTSEEELTNAADEQNKITKLRIENLFS